MEWFTAFAAEAEPRLRFALVAALGQQDGLDATAEALAYGWEHRSRVETMENPIGYLYRVGRSRVRVRIPRSRSRFVPVPVDLLGMSVSTIDTHLDRGLSKLRRIMGVNSDA